MTCPSASPPPTVPAMAPSPKTSILDPAVRGSGTFVGDDGGRDHGPPGGQGGGDFGNEFDHGRLALPLAGFDDAGDAPGAVDAPGDGAEAAQRAAAGAGAGKHAGGVAGAVTHQRHGPAGERGEDHLAEFARRGRLAGRQVQHLEIVVGLAQVVAAVGRALHAAAVAHFGGAVVVEDRTAPALADGVLPGPGQEIGGEDHGTQAVPGGRRPRPDRPWPRPAGRGPRSGIGGRWRRSSSAKVAGSPRGSPATPRAPS